MLDKYVDFAVIIAVDIAVSLIVFWLVKVVLNKLAIYTVLLVEISEFIELVVKALVK